MTERPLILISNDDGADAQGIRELTRMLLPLGDLVVVAPDGPRSGAACSMTVTSPVSLRLLEHTDGLTRYACSGTPADCVKLALSEYDDIAKLDLSMLTEIKRSDKGGVELKLLDRTKILAQLAQLCEGAVRQLPQLSLLRVQIPPHFCEGRDQALAGAVCVVDAHKADFIVGEMLVVHIKALFPRSVWALFCFSSAPASFP